ncbi:MAG: NADH-quinone oxidoreductase subunit NuoK [Peptococcaceae bacterium]|nr:NADH-quinone oxidoreductase subunit NuoK [Peptococcaceae bacterium]MEE0546999.1 NADH-quinone oxidoreductase subunit NuoK [Peptococcaceae bacterium]
MIGLTHYLLLGAFLFAIGLFNALAKRNVIAVLMGIELMLNAVNINLLAFNRFVGINGVNGYAFVLIILVVAATEVAVGLALIIKHFRESGNSDVAKIDWLKW